MKPTIRFLLAGALVLAIALGAWGAVFAEKGSPSASPVAGLSHIFAPFLQEDARGPEVQAEIQTETETPQAVEDNPAQHVDEATDTPEVGEDNHGQNEPGQATGEDAGELTGTVTAFDGSSITVDGQLFQLAAGAEGADKLQIGDTVKLEFTTNPDGTVSVREIKVGDQSDGVGDSSGSSNDTSGEDQGSGGSDSGGHDGGGSGGSGGGGDGGGSGG